MESIVAFVHCANNRPSFHMGCDVNAEMLLMVNDDNAEERWDENAHKVCKY